MAVRQASREDLALLAAIELSASERFKTYPAIAAIIDGGGTLPFDELEQALAAGLLWVADDHLAGVVGFLAAGMMDSGMFIHELDTVAEHQGRGHGRAMLETAIRHAKQGGLPHIALTTFHDIAWNRPWYERHGFRTLRVDEMPPALSQRIAAERDHWDHTGWRRCAMMLPLRS